jgi:hypothetical protein
MADDDSLDSFLDNVFLGCAFAAYVELAAEQRGVPDMEATKQRAYRYYEEALAEKNRRKSALPPDQPRTIVSYDTIEPVTCTARPGGR